MMIRTLLVCLLLMSSIWLGVQLQHDPGYVFIELRHWTIELSVWTALITLLVLFSLLHGCLLFVSWLIHFPRRWKKRRALRQAQRALDRQHLEQTRTFKRHLALKTTPEAYFALGQLLDDLNDPAGACSTYREGLRCALAIKDPLK